jgi:hypothetical protein
MQQAIDPLSLRIIISDYAKSIYQMTTSRKFLLGKCNIGTYSTLNPLCLQKKKRQHLNDHMTSLRQLSPVSSTNIYVKIFNIHDFFFRANILNLQKSQTMPNQPKHSTNPTHTSAVAQQTAFFMHREMSNSDEMLFQRRMSDSRADRAAAAHQREVEALSYTLNKQLKDDKENHQFDLQESDQHYDQLHKMYTAAKLTLDTERAISKGLKKENTQVRALYRQANEAVTKIRVTMHKLQQKLRIKRLLPARKTPAPCSSPVPAAHTTAAPPTVHTRRTPAPSPTQAAPTTPAAPTALQSLVDYRPPYLAKTTTGMVTSMIQFYATQDLEQVKQQQREIEDTKMEEELEQNETPVPVATSTPRHKKAQAGSQQRAPNTSTVTKKLFKPAVQRVQTRSATKNKLPLTFPEFLRQQTKRGPRKTREEAFREFKRNAPAFQKRLGTLIIKETARSTPPWEGKTLLTTTVAEIHTAETSPEAEIQTAETSPEAEIHTAETSPEAITHSMPGDTEITLSYIEDINDSFISFLRSTEEDSNLYPSHSYLLGINPPSEPYTPANSPVHPFCTPPTTPTRTQVDDMDQLPSYLTETSPHSSSYQAAQQPYFTSTCLNLQELCADTQSLSLMNISDETVPAVTLHRTHQDKDEWVVKPSSG